MGQVLVGWLGLLDVLQTSLIQTIGREKWKRRNGEKLRRPNSEGRKKTEFRHPIAIVPPPSLSTIRSPSPLPSPPGRGSIIDRAFENPSRLSGGNVARGSPSPCGRGQG